MKFQRHVVQVEAVDVTFDDGEAPVAQAPVEVDRAPVQGVEQDAFAVMLARALHHRFV